MANLLVVDDEKGYREVLTVIFESEGHSVRSANNGRTAVEMLRSGLFDVCISDVKMPDMNGVELLRTVREILPDLAVILMTAFGTIDTAREAFKLGADDFIQKPFSNDELKLIVQRALDRQALVSENRAFRLAQRKSGSTSNILGSSQKIQEMHQKIAMVAGEESTVLITGESGSGKELVARAIHDLSPRAEKPFIPINCGAMPETLLESELFGFMKGTFTGAVQNRAGMFESADKGSIFLDEIGDMSPSMQVKMLRVLQERRVRRIGASSETAVDTRVIAATNRDIRPTGNGDGFRSDLYYRISVIPLAVPPLRERREDIPELAEHFVKRFSARSGKKVRISDEAMSVLKNRPWPGNVRELEHTVERAVAFTENGEAIAASHCADDQPLVPSTAYLPADGIHLPTHLNCLEKDFVTEALNRTNGNQTRAAELLQIPVHAIRHLLDKHNLR